jgi:hypothetical protein
MGGVVKKYITNKLECDGVVKKYINNKLECEKYFCRSHTEHHWRCSNTLFYKAHHTYLQSEALKLL